jgi:hypothetical protein
MGTSTSASWRTQAPHEGSQHDPACPITVAPPQAPPPRRGTANAAPYATVAPLAKFQALGLRSEKTLCWSVAGTLLIAVNCMA